ncbi:protein of unknown function DUF112 transmembrane [Methanococcus vannielii SB]|uniref:DUF112 domain-containing protein n=1 Tax=Methanococcus vannielii (strain ATCC 35089 / DSM 1224 / JCM 13029 / OCM 148 / SB) TaxID=406327 RepID=A6UQI2_METVS|nr:tripartite tricarboxylate transporter permease [Methanococcus vannielii]ABR54754.1 protein of unknown function DUF112 transmembrane [Methanococcus vannielii SB]
MVNLFFVAFGAITGSFTGLIPGIHPNLLIPFSTILLPYFGQTNYFGFLMGLVISHYFLNYIPSAFIGVPDSESAVSSIPMHKLTKDGKGYEAVILAGMGGFLGIIFSSILFLIIFTLNLDLNSIYGILKPFLPYILIILIFTSIIFSKNKFWTFLVILFSGTLGISVFYINPSYNNTMAVLFTGMFGIPFLITNLGRKKLGYQYMSFPKLNGSYLKSVVFGTIGGFLRIFIPATGGAQINYFLSKLIKEENIENFIVSQGAITLSNELFSILALVLIGTGRSGIAETIKNLNLEYTAFDIFGSIFLASGLSLLFLSTASKYVLKNINRYNYGDISKYLIIFCTFLIFLLTFNNYFTYHAVIYIVSISIGIICIKKQVNMSNMMSVLIFPTIFYFLGIY